MQASALFAFIHHLAAFPLMGALAAQLVSVDKRVDSTRMVTLRRADLLYGISAGVLLAAGLVQVFYFEKGSDYYLHNVFFLAKLGLFLLVALLSIYPTLRFLAWHKQLDSSPFPIAHTQLARVRAVIWMELAGVAGIVLCASLMARKIGMLE